MNQKKENKQNDISRLLQIAGEKKSLLALSSIFSIISTILQFVPFLAIYFIIEELLKNATDPSMIDTLLIRNWGLGAFLLLVASLFCQYISMMASHIAAFRILYGLRVKLSEHLAKLPMGYHTKESSGKIKKILEISVEKIENFVAHQFPDFVSAVVFPVIMIIGMFLLDWRLALATSIPLLVVFIIQGLLFSGEKSRLRTKKYHNALEDMSATGVEYVRGMPAVKVFGLTVKSFLKFNHSINNYKTLTLDMCNGYKHTYTTFFIALSSLLSFILPIGIFILSGQPGNQAFALTLILFLIIVPGISIPVLKLMYLGGNLRQISEGITRIDEIFSQKPTPEPVNPKLPKSFTIKFENVNFSYDSINAATRTDALTEISFTAKERQITALVGPSGSGKTTIANLISRFWDVSDGNITIGGIHIKQMGTEKLMDTVSFVFQDVHMFYDTIEENIRMGNTSATHEQVVKAAIAARCHDFIEKLPLSYETKIGEGGTYLSGGEAQRISIARAILKDSPILVLDEATAFADPENEAKMQKAISTLMQKKTVVIIAHRLSTIRQADQIIVLNKGRIAEQGKHDNLVKQNGLYSRMWKAHIDANSWTLPKDREERMELE